MFIPNEGHTPQPRRAAPQILRFELQENATDDRHSSEESKGREKRQKASRSKVKQIRNNARIKTTLKSDFLRFMFLASNNDTKERIAKQSKRNERRLSFTSKAGWACFYWKEHDDPASFALAASVLIYLARRILPTSRSSMRRRLSCFNSPRRLRDSAYQKEHGLVSPLSSAFALLPVWVQGKNKRATEQKQTNAHSLSLSTTYMPRTPLCRVGSHHHLSRWLFHWLRHTQLVELPLPPHCHRCHCCAATATATAATLSRKGKIIS